MGKTVRLKDETYEELVKIGKKNETFDDIIRRLLECYKKHTDR